MKKVLKRFIQAELLRDESGGELIEYAVSATVLFMMIFGIMDLSRAMYTYHYVAIAARQATRYASVRGATWTSTLCLLSTQFQCAATSASVTSFVKSVTPLGFNASNLTVSTTWPGTTPTGTDCSLLNINNSPGCVVSVKVAYSFNFVLPFLPRNALGADQYIQCDDRAVVRFWPRSEPGAVLWWMHVEEDLGFNVSCAFLCGAFRADGGACSSCDLCGDFAGSGRLAERDGAGVALPGGDQTGDRRGGGGGVWRGDRSIEEGGAGGF